MKESRYVGALLSILAACCAGSAYAATEAAYDIRLDLEPGRQFRIAMDYGLTQEGYGGGDELMRMAAIMTFTVVERAGSGCRLRAAYDSLAVKSTGLFGMDASSGADLSAMDDDITDQDYLLCLLFKGMMGLPFEVEVGERWDVHGVEGIDTLRIRLVDRVMELAKLDNRSMRETLLEATGKVFTPQRLTELLRSASAGYPQSPIALGGSWTSAERNNAESLTYLTEATYTLRGVRWAELDVGVEGRIRPDTAEDAREIEGTQQGSMVIDRETGLVLFAELHQSLELAVSGYGGGSTASLRGEASVRTDFPNDERRERWREAVTSRSVTYGIGGTVVVGVAPGSAAVSDPACMSALSDITDALGDVLGVRTTESIRTAPVVRVADGVVEVVPWSAQDSALNAEMVTDLQTRPDIAGRLLARRGDAALVDAELAEWAIERQKADTIGMIIEALRGRYPDMTLSVAAPSLAGYCRVEADTVIAWGALNDEWSRWLGTEPDRADIARLTGGLTHLEYSFESGAANGICDSPFVSRIDSFVVWARRQPEVARVTSMFELLPLLDSLPSWTGANEKTADIGECAERLASLDMGSAPPGLLHGHVSAPLSATRITVVVGPEEGAVERLWARSLKWLSHGR